MHTSRLTRAPGDPVLVQKIFAPSPALQAYSEFHSSKSAHRARGGPPNANVKIKAGIHAGYSRSRREKFLGGTAEVLCETADKMLIQPLPSRFPSGAKILCRSCRQPSVFVPSPAQAGQQTVHVVAGIVHSEAAPDHTGDPFRGPDGRIKSVPPHQPPPRTRARHESRWLRPEGPAWGPSRQ